MRAAVLCLLAAACGDNATAPDALVADAIDAPDAAPDAPPPPAGCDWGELADADNHTAPEATGLQLGDRLVICGQIDTGHTVEATGLVDDDAFGFALAAETAIRVELVGDFGPLGVELAIVNRFGDPLATSRFAGTHAITAARLPAGAYGVAVRALGDEPSAPIAYQATITPDPSTCEVQAVTYTESAADNDVVEVRFTGDPALRRVLTTGTPEPTALVLGAPVRLAGTAADVDAPDEFRDRDTFAVATAADVDTLTVRVDWTASGVDLDLLVFPASTLPEIAGATHIATAGPEAATFAVLPGTTYWIWIGAYDTSAGLPASYDVTLCAE